MLIKILKYVAVLFALCFIQTFEGGDIINFIIFLVALWKLVNPVEKH